MVHEQQAEVRADESTTAESHDGHAGRHAGAIRKPSHQSRNRRNVTQTEPATANHAVAKVDDPKLVPPNAKGRDDKAAAKTKMARLKIHASDGCDQSPGADLVTPMILVSGNLKTLNA